MGSVEGALETTLFPFFFLFSFLPWPIFSLSTLSLSLSLWSLSLLLFFLLFLLLQSPRRIGVRMSAEKFGLLDRIHFGFFLLPSCSFRWNQPWLYLETFDLLRIMHGKKQLLRLRVSATPKSGARIRARRHQDGDFSFLKPRIDFIKGNEKAAFLVDPVRTQNAV